MAIKFRKNAVKFLAKANPGDVAKIREKLSQLLLFVPLPSDAKTAAV